MKWRGLGLFLSSLFTWTMAAAQSQLPVFDQDFSCISRSEAEGFVDDLGIDFESFGGLELCNSNVDTKKLFNDLVLVRDGRFSGNKSNMFIRNFIPAQSYFSWLKRMTRGIRRGHDVPYATAYNSGGYFTMQDGWAKLSTLGRVGALLHEARHTAGYMHIECSQGPYQDCSVYGCDETLPEGGSHGVEMEYYSRVILQGTNFHPVYTQMARLMNLARANFVFNDNPLRAEPALVALGGSDLSLLQDQLVTWPVNHSGSMALKTTSYGAALNEGALSYAIDFGAQAANVDLLPDEYSYFKIFSFRPLGKIADTEEFDVGTRRFFVALTQSGELHTYVFPQGSWSNPAPARDVIRLTTVAPDGSEGLFAVLSSMQVVPIHPETLRRGTPLQAKWPNNTVDFVNWQGQLLEVVDDGSVRTSRDQKKFAPLAGKAIQQMVRAPVYKSF